MATVTTSFASTASLEAAYAAQNSGWSLTSAMTWGQAAYDYAYYYGVQTYSTTSSSHVAGTLTNGDLFSAFGSNLTGYPYTITQLDYIFASQGVTASLYGASTRSTAGGSPTGYVNKVVVSAAPYGSITINGFDNVALVGDGTISSVTRNVGGAILTATGALTASISIVNGFYQASVAGNYNSGSLSYAGQTIQFSNIAVNANANFSSAGDFLSAILAGSDTVNGTTGSEFLSGYGGNDTLNGLAGNDTLDGGSGNDALNGGDGNDTYIVDSTGDTISESTGTDTVQSYLWWLLGNGLENLTLIGSAAYGVGNALNNVITGNGESNPLLRGEGGNDVIFGGGGNDWIEGDSNANAGMVGNDVLLGEAGDDTVFGGPGDDVVALGAGFDVAVGEAGDDAINGEGGNDAIDGGTGNDTLLGGDDQDILFGSVGGDILYGDNGDDIMMGNRGDPIDLIDGVDLMFGDAGQDTIHGGAGDDGILGGAGNDVIDGGIGNDAIVGGLGADILLGSGINLFNSAQFPTGTPGSDLFIYSNINEAGDSIYGFDLRAGNEDRLFLEPLLNTFTNGATGTTLALLNASGHLRLLDTGADVAVQVDADGGGNNYTTLVTLIGVANTTDLNDAHFFLQM